MTTDLTPSVPKPIWLDRFTNRLDTLLPTLDPQTASAHAEATFPSRRPGAGGRGRNLALELPSDEPGAPGD
jgi:hypothetical protein